MDDDATPDVSGGDVESSDTGESTGAEVDVETTTTEASETVATDTPATETATDVTDDAKPLSLDDLYPTATPPETASEAEAGLPKTAAELKSFMESALAELTAAKQAEAQAPQAPPNTEITDEEIENFGVDPEATKSVMQKYEARVDQRFDANVSELTAWTKDEFMPTVYKETQRYADEQIAIAVAPYKFPELVALGDQLPKGIGMELQANPKLTIPQAVESLAAKVKAHRANADSIAKAENKDKRPAGTSGIANPVNGRTVNAASMSQEEAQRVKTLTTWGKG